MGNIILETIFATLVEYTLNTTFRKFKNTALGQKVLKRLGLHELPEANDFEGLYKYTFLKYGFDNQISQNDKELYHLFSDTGLQKAFELSFDTGNPIAVQECLDAIFDANEKTNELGDLARQDAEKAVNTFRQVFLDVVQKTRPKYDVLNQQKHDAQFSDILDGINELNNEYYATQQFNKLINSVSGQLEKELADIKDAWTSGEMKNIFSVLSEKRTDKPLWEALSPELRSKWLRTEVVFLLEIRKDVSNAKTLFEEAQQLQKDTQDDDYIQSLIYFCEYKYEQSLNLVNRLTHERGLHLKAIIFIQLERYDEAYSILNVIKSSSNIHIHFTRARLALQQGDIELSIEAIQEALNHSINSPDMLFWLAQLKYLSALSPAIQPKTLQILPEPILPIFFRTSPKYVTRLQEAHDIFQQLLEHQTEKRWENLLLWHLACRFLLEETAENLIEYCQRLIDEHEFGVLATVWATNYRLDLDYDKAIEKIQAIIGDNPTIHQITALTSCYTNINQQQKAIDLLLSSKELFEESIDVWHHNLIAVYISMDDFKSAGKYITELTDTTEKAIKELVLVKIKGDEIPNDYLFNLEPDNSLLLLEICELAHEKKLYDFIVGHSVALFEEINAPCAFDLIIEATYHSDKRKCLEFIEKLIEEYHPFSLPPTYQNIHLRCLRETGQFVKAYQLAKSVDKHYWDDAVLISILSIYEHVGDLESFIPVAKNLLSREDISTNINLRVASIVSMYDIDLSTKLWRKTMKQDIPDNEVGFAFMLADTLGVKAETEDLADRMHTSALSGQLGMRLMKLEDLPEFMKNFQHDQQNANKLYRLGKLPIHFVASNTPNSFTWLYHEQREIIEQTGNLNLNYALLTRYAGRPVIRSFDLDTLKGKLSFDITTILLNHYFDTLDNLEKSFAPICISSLLIPKLIELALQHHQKDREYIKACNNIVKYTELYPNSVIDPQLSQSYSNDLITDLGEDWLNLYEYVKKNDGYLVNFMPIRKRGLTNDLAELPTHYSTYLTDIRGVLDALLKYSVITSGEYTELIHGLGNSVNRMTNTELQRGRVVVFYSNTLEVIAGKDILSKAASIFDIKIINQQVLEVKQALHRESRVNEFVGKLLGLIKQLFKGILNDIYYLAPPIKVDKDIERTLEVSSLLEIADYCQKKGRVIVADDSYWSSIIFDEQPYSLTSIDLLGAMVQDNNLETDEYYHLLMRFRRSGLRYIPYWIDEIINQLDKNYDKQSLSIFENLPIETMKNYIHACLSQIDFLQLEQNELGTKQNRDILFFRISFDQICKALVHLWRDYYGERSNILTEWIIENLYLPNRDIFIQYGVFDPNVDENEFPYPELYGLSKFLETKGKKGWFSHAQRYRIHLWHWYERNKNQL